MVAMGWAFTISYLVVNSLDNVVDARLSPLSPNIFDEWRAGYRVREQEESLQEQIARYTREGRFPQAGRSLLEKIDEANEFLDRELAIEEQRGVGVSGAIVYQDNVVLSRGYALARCEPARILARCTNYSIPTSSLNSVV